MTCFTLVCYLINILKLAIYIRKHKYLYIVIFYLQGNDIKFIIYGIRGSVFPSESVYDFICELPNTDPEESYCGPEALRNESQTSFYSAYLNFYETHKTSLDFWQFLTNSSMTRCSRAIFGAAHPFICHFTADQLGRSKID